MRRFILLITVLNLWLPVALQAAPQPEHRTVRMDEIIPKQLPAKSVTSTPVWLWWLIGGMGGSGLLLAVLARHLWYTAHVRATQLADQTQLYRGVFDSTFHLQGVLSPEGILLHANRTSLDFAGLTEAEVIGKNFCDTPWWTHDPNEVEQLKRMIKLCASGKQIRFESTHTTQAGEIRFIDCSLSPLFDDAGTLKYLIPEGRDITEIKQFEKKLQEKKAFLEAMYNALPFGFWARDTEGTLILQNTINEEQYGNPLGSTLQESCREPGVYTLWQHCLEQSMEGIPLDLEVREGERILRKIVTPIKADGQVIGTFGLNIDITDRHRLMERLQDGERRFKAIFEELPFIVTLNDLQTTAYLDVNPCFCQFNAITKEEAIGKEPPEIGRFISKELHDWLVGEMHRTGRIDLQEITIRRHDGEERTGLFSSRIIRMEGQPRNLTVIQDITELKQAQKALDAARSRELTLLVQHEKMQMIGGLAAGMAHEINNPTGIIAHELQNLERRLLPDLPGNRTAAERIGINMEQLDAYLHDREIPLFISHIDQAARRISNIVNNMLQFSRQSGADRQPTDLHRLVSHAVELTRNDLDLRKRFGIADVVIELHLQDALPLVPTMPTEIEQVLINLIKNACQAMYGQTDERRIDISLQRREENLHIQVSDNGPGIPEAIRQRIFEPFFTTKQPGSGTGLGLAISYAIVVERHHGMLTVDHNDTRGACFTVSLPLTITE